jgi:hypothetical protein
MHCLHLQDLILLIDVKLKATDYSLFMALKEEEAGSEFPTKPSRFFLCPPVNARRSGKYGGALDSGFSVSWPRFELCVMIRCRRGCHLSHLDRRSLAKDREIEQGHSVTLLANERIC